MKGLKSALALLCVAVVLIGGAMHYSEEYVAEVNEAELNDILSIYYGQREGEFTGECAVSTYGVFDGKSRNAVIEEWKEDLNLEVKDVKVEYSIEEIVHNTADEVQLLVYEWTWVDYVSETDGTEDTMGFGTDHLMTFSKETYGLELMNDVYSEVIGYESGTEEELEALYVEAQLAEEAASIMCEETDIYEEAAMQGEYDIATCESEPLPKYVASSAVAYSNKWCGRSEKEGTDWMMTPSKYNPSYYYYAGKDCCNFISQCLYAGGLPMSSTWKAELNTSGVVQAADDSLETTYAWMNTDGLQKYWKSQGFTVRRITSSSDAIIGNPIFWLATDGYDNNHITLIVGTDANGRVLVNGHNPDMYRYPMNLSEYKFYMLDVAHDLTYKYVSNTWHYLYCDYCGYSQTDYHTFYTSNGTTFTCTGCGYKKNW